MSYRPRSLNRDGIICYVGILVLIILCISIGLFTATVNGAPTTEEPPAWSLLAKTLGKDPNKADAIDLGVALKLSLVARPDLLIPLIQTASALACKLQYPRACILMVVQIGVDARQDRLVDIVSAAHAVCPDGVRGVEEKLVITPDYEPDLTPKWTPPEFPQFPIFTPVTPVFDVPRK